MTMTALASMVVADVELRSQPSVLKFQANPMDCDHLWEPHLWEFGRAHCPCCGSFARWVNDPREREEPAL